MVCDALSFVTRVRAAQRDQRYAPRKKFMKLKDFQTPFIDAPRIMELLVLPGEQLPVVCVV